MAACIGEVYAAVGCEEVSLAEGMLAQTQHCASTQTPAADFQEDGQDVVEDQDAQLLASHVRYQRQGCTFAVHMAML